MFEIILSPDAQDVYANADAPLARKLTRCFAQLERNPIRHPNVKRLSGSLSESSRYRVGDWRVVFRVDQARRQVNVSTIAPRRDVYE